MGYTWNGDAAIAGLLKIEADALMLGELVQQDPENDSDASDSSDSFKQHKRDIRQRHRQHSKELFADLHT
jgi:hypothetical protein